MGLWLRGGGGWGEGGYQCGSLEVLEAPVYVKWPILFSSFNMMSDWISWFNFTEGVKGFHCWFLMIVFHGLACITLLSFATAMTSQSVTVFTIYLHNLVVSLVLILVNSLLLYLFNSVQLYSFGSIHKKSGNPKMRICNWNPDSELWKQDWKWNPESNRTVPQK